MQTYCTRPRCKLDVVYDVKTDCHYVARFYSNTRCICGGIVRSLCIVLPGRQPWRETNISKVITRIPAGIYYANVSWISQIICNLITLREQLHGIYFNMENDRAILTCYIFSILLKKQKKKKRKVHDVHQIPRFHQKWKIGNKMFGRK